MKALIVNVEHLGKPSTEFFMHLPWQVVIPLIPSPLIVNR